MNPSGLDGAWCLFERAKIATLFTLALATKSILPSGVNDILFGVLPGGAFGWSAQETVSSPSPVAASSMLTLVEFAQATSRRFPSGVRIISVGWRSVGQVPITLFVSSSITATAALFHKLTYKRRPFRSTRQAYG